MGVLFLAGIDQPVVVQRNLRSYNRNRQAWPDTLTDRAWASIDSMTPRLVFHDIYLFDYDSDLSLVGSDGIFNRFFKLQPPLYTPLRNMTAEPSLVWGKEKSRAVAGVGTHSKCTPTARLGARCMHVVHKARKDAFRRCFLLYIVVYYSSLVSARKKLCGAESARCCGWWWVCFGCSAKVSFTA